jgi:hypothetical protein
MFPNTMLLAAQAYGRRVGVRVPATEAAAVRPLLPYWWVDSNVAPEKVWDIPDAQAARFVISELELWIAEHAENLVFIHAGVVAVDGKAIVLPGKSMSGKTTLVVELLKAGADYGSDEYAVLDANGLVHPYPRPLWVRDNNSRRRITAAELGARTFLGPLPAKLTAFLHYSPNEPAETRSISPAIGALRLLENSVSARSRPQSAITHIAAVIKDCSLVEGSRTDAHKWASELMKFE